MQSITSTEVWSDSHGRTVTLKSGPTNTPPEIVNTYKKHNAGLTL